MRDVRFSLDDTFRGEASETVRAIDWHHNALSLATNANWRCLQGMSSSYRPRNRLLLAARIAGKPTVFIGVFSITVIWFITGPVFGWSQAWQIVANTVTSVVTFLMVFVIQDSQNRDSAAIQTKLDELIRKISPASNLVGIEDLTHEEIELIKERRAHA
jgi:low affinity Fe/Cu permease